MPLYKYPPAPLIINTPGIENSSNFAAVVAGSAYFQLIKLDAPVTVTNMRCYFNGSPTGNIDLGIYDSSGTNGGPNNLLGHTGINVAATSMFTKALSANLALAPGNYWLAFLDTVADSVSSRQSAFSGMGPQAKTTSTSLTVLPNTAGAIADINFLVALFALVSGGYS